MGNKDNGSLSFNNKTTATKKKKLGFSDESSTYVTSTTEIYQCSVGGVSESEQVCTWTPEQNFDQLKFTAVLANIGVKEK